MNIIEACQKAAPQGFCIVRSLGLMKSRILQSTKRFGWLKADQFSPVFAPAVESRYSLTPEDILAADWNIKEDIDLIDKMPDGEPQDDDCDPAAEVLESLYERLMSESVPTDIETAARVLNILTDIEMKRSQWKEGEKHDSQ